MSELLEFSVNGERVAVRDLAPTTTLLQFLRSHLGLTGTKEGCAEGDCGACTVAFLEPDAPGGAAFRAVNGCLVLLPSCQGRSIYTVEGLREGKAPHPVQEALVQALGSQCGYCTPGVVMSMFEACYRPDLDEAWKLDDQLCGNLCRCTGYRPIREATQQIAGLRPKDRFTAALAAAEPGSRAVDYSTAAQRFVAPATFEALWPLLAHPEARLVAGATDLGLEVTKRFVEHPLLVSLEAIPELARLDVEQGALRIGAMVRLADLEAAAREVSPPVQRMLRFFGARQIKNRGTVGGNLCTASAIGDLAPVFLALGAQVVLRSSGGQRRFQLEEFFVAYRKTALVPGEILEAVELPALPAGDVRAAAYKVSKRQELDISAVAAGLFVRLDAAGAVEEARFGFGGMAATPARARRAEAAALGAPWCEETAERAAVALAEDFRPIDDHRGSAWYRRTVAANLIRGFYLETQRAKLPRLPYRPTGTVSPEEVSS